MFRGGIENIVLNDPDPFQLHCQVISYSPGIPFTVQNTCNLRNNNFNVVLDTCVHI